MSLDFSNLKFNADGLIPAIVQDIQTDQVLMMAYMNTESMAKTLETAETWFFSRSRQQLWHKGETSGHLQKVKELFYDCDADTLLVKVEQIGVACHTGEKSCFFNRLPAQGSENPCLAKAGPEKDVPAKYNAGKGSVDIIFELFEVISDRYEKRPEGSYTTYLFTKGLDKILKKVGEEAAEVIIGAKNRNKDEVVYEAADLLYHLLVLLKEQNIEPGEVFAELSKRR